MAQDEALVLMSGPGKRQFTGIILTQVAVSYRHELLQQISKFCRRFCGVNVRLVRASDLRIFSSSNFLKHISLLAQIGIFSQQPKLEQPAPKHFESVLRYYGV